MVAVGFRVYFGFGMCLEPIGFSIPTTFNNLDAQSADPPTELPQALQMLPTRHAQRDQAARGRQAVFRVGLRV